MHCLQKYKISFQKPAMKRSGCMYRFCYKTPRSLSVLRSVAGKRHWGTVCYMKQTPELLMIKLGDKPAHVRPPWTQMETLKQMISQQEKLPLVSLGDFPDLHSGLIWTKGLKQKRPGQAAVGRGRTSNSWPRAAPLQS